MLELVRLAHLHAVLDEGDAFSEEVVAFADFAGVDAFAGVVVDGFGAGGAEVGVVGDEVLHLGGEFVQPVEA